MDWFRYMALPQLRQSAWWKRFMIDIAIAILFVAVVTISAYLLHTHQRVAPATSLLVCLIILLFLAHKGGPRVAILAAILVCITFDFFLLNPLLSLWLADLQEALDLCFFLVVAILANWIFAQHNKLANQANRLNELESIRFEERLQEQRTEVSRRDDELRAMYDVIMYVSREQKDLKAQLKQRAQTIADAFYFCGIRGCAFYLFDLEGDGSMWILSSRGDDMPKLSSSDEVSVMCVMRDGQSLTLQDLPVVLHTQSSYLRRIVTSNVGVDLRVNRCNYLVPLLSGQKVLGVMRLYIEDNANAELEAIKSILRGENISPGIHAELFSRLRDQTVSMIEQSLIERALVLKESLRQELQKRTEEMHTDIISSVSHDFHTPLAQIMGAASGLLNHSPSWEDEATCHELLRAIVGETERLERIVGKMLALSRIEYGAFSLKRELYPVETIILNTLDQGHMRSLKQGRHIEIRVPDDVPPVMLDPDLIGQVFTNLIENAIRYTPVESLIEISVRADDEQVFVTVADRGRGIPPDELERVFVRFHRVKQAVLADMLQLSNQGSGLGLAVCRGFVDAHGGRIWADNRRHGGAKFTFSLPLHVTEGGTDEKDTAG